MKEGRIYIVLRILLGIIFIWASWEKILDPHGFARVVKNYAILPDEMVKGVALFLPWLEAICGILLVSNYLVKGSAFIIDMLMGVFIIALIFNMFRGIDVSCGCFSNTLKPITKWEYSYEILRDVVIMGTGVWVLLYKIRMEPSASSHMTLQEGN